MQPVSKFSPREAVLQALPEYLYTVLPVFVYISIEAFAHKGPLWLLISPEWNIATIFLSLEGFINSTKLLKSSGQALLGLIMVLFIILAVVAAYQGCATMAQGGPTLLQHIQQKGPTVQLSTSALVLQWVLFPFASFGQITLAAARALQAGGPQP